MVHVERLVRETFISYSVTAPTSVVDWGPQENGTLTELPDGRTAIQWSTDISNPQFNVFVVWLSTMGK